MTPCPRPWTKMKKIRCLLWWYKFQSQVPVMTTQVTKKNLPSKVTKILLVVYTDDEDHRDGNLNKGILMI